MEVLTFLENRFAALTRGDYVAVYNSYHCDAPFLEQFCDLETYLDFARQQLSGIRVKNWSSPRQRQLGAGRLEAILVMEIETAAGSQYYYELALLLETAAGWRYHSAQKLGTEDYSGLPAKIDFADFESAPHKIRF